MAETKEEKAAREAAEQAAAEQAAGQTAGSNAQPAPVADEPETPAEAPAYKSVQDPITGAWTRSL